MKKLKLTDITKSKIENDQMNEIKGGNEAIFCIFSCSSANCGRVGRAKKDDRVANRHS